MSILRLSHVEIRVPDLELATAYYSEVVGMIETGRDASRVFLKCWDEHQHHSVVLTLEPTHGLNHFGFKVTDAGDLDEYQARLEAAGVPVRLVLFPITMLQMETLSISTVLTQTVLQQPVACARLRSCSVPAMPAPPRRR